MTRHVKEAAQRRLDGPQGHEDTLNGSDYIADLVICRPELALAILDLRLDRFEEMLGAFGGLVEGMHSRLGVAT